MPSNHGLPGNHGLNESPDVDAKALMEAFAAFTETTRRMEESYRRLEVRLESLDEELQAKNQQLELTTDYLNSILDSMSDGVIAVDTDGVVTTFNRAASETFGYSANDVIGTSFRELFNRDFAVDPALRMTELTDADGQGVPVSERNSPIADTEGTRIGTVKVFQDLREIEELRQHAQRKDRLAAIGEMAATVAHEIRNPLGGIRGFATLLQRDTPPEDPRSRLIDKILTGTKNLDRVVNELLEYTRPMDLELECADCATLVDTALGLATLNRPEVLVVNRVNSGEVVAADPNKMCQVLLNVVLNAIQSIEGEGEVRIGTLPEEEFTVISVEDTGCGIPPDQLERVCSPFFTTKEKGTGLGLAVATKIVESHGGTLTVTSTVGAGTNVRIRLPRGK